MLPARTRLAPTCLLVACAALFVVAPRPSSAQETGGSFGGGDFGGSDSSGSGSSGSSDFGGSSGSDFGGSDYGNSGGSSVGFGSSSGGGDAGGGACCTITVFLILIVAVGIYGTRQARSWPGGAPSGAAAGGMDVSAIRIALDHHARAALQQKLAGLAGSAGSSTKAGLATALHEVCVELRRNETAWLYSNVENSPMIGPREAEAAFRRIAADARARFRIETVRGEGGQVRTQVDTTVRDRGEGPGIVVVTVVVAARRDLVDVHQPEDARALHGLLTAFGALSASELVALEIVWSPSAEDDRMTVEEMKRVYPELRQIRDDTVQSRLFCGYCGSPFWNGLSRCPHCGGPATDGRPAGATPGAPA